MSILPQCACCNRRITTSQVHYICEPCFVDVTSVETDSDLEDGSDVELEDSEDLVAEHIRDHIVPPLGAGSRGVRSVSARISEDVDPSEDAKMDSKEK